MPWSTRKRAVLLRSGITAAQLQSSTATLALAVVAVVVLPPLPQNAQNRFSAVDVHGPGAFVAIDLQRTRPGTRFLLEIKEKLDDEEEERRGKKN
jgi:hypothetical protein